MSTVRNIGEVNGSFDCPTGLKQGCLCSPTLFCIFLTEVSRQLNLHGKHGIQLMSGLIEIHHILFAYDTLLVSDTIGGLQIRLNILYEQCVRLGLIVNMIYN